METRLIKGEIDTAPEILKRGGLVAVPTETVYGLAGNGLSESAVQKIYEVKGRPAIKPLSLMVRGAEDMERYCLDVPADAKLLAEKFWPGPLTIVLKAKEIVPDIVRAGGETVGLRCPDHPLTLKLLEKAKIPFAAPSANPSGQPSPKNAQTVMEYFDGDIDAVIDGGECGIGTESTLILMSDVPYRILRQGALMGEAIADALMESMRIVGITGGSGSGKTTALKTAQELGAYTVDCDELYHDMLSSDDKLRADIETAFPGTVKDGAVDRAALRSIVFHDKDKLAELNRVTHAHITRKVRELLRDAAMDGVKFAAIDASELLESDIKYMCTRLLGVTAPISVRLERITARDGISRESALERLMAQHDDDYFVSHCDSVIENGRDREAFIDSCKKYFMEVLR